MSYQIRDLLCLMALAIAGCDLTTDGSKASTADTGPGGTCLGSISSAAVAYDRIDIVCVGGTSPIGYPPNFELTVPWYDPYYMLVNPYLAWPTPSSSSYDSTTDEFGLGIEHGTAGSPLLSAEGLDGYLWDYEFTGSCSDYTLNNVDFYYIDGASFGWSPGLGVACGTPPPPPPPAPLGRVPTGPQTCTVGQAEFRLAARRIFLADDSKGTMWLSPLLTEDAVFPERAWLREIEVTDWGDATNLVLANYLDTLEADGWDLTGTTIARPESGSTVVTFDAGEVPMTVMMGTENVPLSGGNADLPIISISWSCENDPQDPHSIAVPSRTGHVAVLSEMLPIKHRLVFWVADDGTDVRMAPEGRYLDYVQSKLTTAPSGGKSFRLRLAPYDATLEGRLVPFEGSYKLMDGVVTIDTATYNLPTKVMTAL